MKVITAWRSPSARILPDATWSERSASWIASSVHCGKVVHPLYAQPQVLSQSRFNGGRRDHEHAQP